MAITGSFIYHRFKSQDIMKDQRAYMHTFSFLSDSFLMRISGPGGAWLGDSFHVTLVELKGWLIKILWMVRGEKGGDKEVKWKSSDSNSGNET